MSNLIDDPNSASGKRLAGSGWLTKAMLDEIAIAVLAEREAYAKEADHYFGSSQNTVSNRIRARET